MKRDVSGSWRRAEQRFMQKVEPGSARQRLGTAVPCADLLPGDGRTNHHELDWIRTSPNRLDAVPSSCHAEAICHEAPGDQQILMELLPEASLRKGPASTFLKL